jgi:hypothetical protein
MGSEGLALRELMRQLEHAEAENGRLQARLDEATELLERVSFEDSCSGVSDEAIIAVDAFLAGLASTPEPPVTPEGDKP